MFQLELMGLLQRRGRIVSRPQLLKLGVAESTIDRWLGSGYLVPLHRGVYLVGGGSPTFVQRVSAARLAAGEDAVACMRTAGVLLGLDGCEPGIIDLACPRKLRIEGVIGHRRRSIPKSHVATVGGIPCTGVALTLVELGAVVSEEVVELSLIGALRDRKASVEWLLMQLDELGGAGRDGAGVLRGLLDSIDPGEAIPASVLEVLARRLVRAGLPKPQFQYPVETRPGHFRYVDLAYPEARLAIELDGARWHFGPRALERDRERDNELTQVAWRLLHFWWRHIRHEPDYFVSTVKASLRNPFGPTFPSSVRGNRP